MTCDFSYDKLPSSGLDSNGVLMRTPSRLKTDPKMHTSKRSEETFKKERPVSFFSSILCLSALASLFASVSAGNHLVVENTQAQHASVTEVCRVIGYPNAANSDLKYYQVGVTAGTIGVSTCTLDIYEMFFDGTTSQSDQSFTNTVDCTKMCKIQTSGFNMANKKLLVLTDSGNINVYQFSDSAPTSLSTGTGGAYTGVIQIVHLPDTDYLLLFMGDMTMWKADMSTDPPTMTSETYYGSISDLDIMRAYAEQVNGIGMLFLVGSHSADTSQTRMYVFEYSASAALTFKLDYKDDFYPTSIAIDYAGNAVFALINNAGDTWKVGSANVNTLISTYTAIYDSSSFFSTSLTTTTVEVSVLRDYLSPSTSTAYAFYANTTSERYLLYDTVANMYTLTGIEVIPTTMAYNLDYIHGVFSIDMYDSASAKYLIYQLSGTTQFKLASISACPGTKGTGVSMDYKNDVCIATGQTVAATFENSNLEVYLPCEDSHCTTCGGSDTICTTCEGGYEVSAQACSQIDCFTSIPDCSTCLTTGTCSQCTSGKKTNSDKSACYTCGISGCEYCSTDNNCEVCTNPAQKPSLEKLSCLSCLVSGCASCDNSGACVSCTNVALKPSQDGTACVSCTATGCSACNNAGVCQTCTDPTKSVRDLKSVV